jgi:hypothetical protein
MGTRQIEKGGFKGVGIRGWVPWHLHMSQMRQICAQPPFELVIAGTIPGFRGFDHHIAQGPQDEFVRA